MRKKQPSMEDDVGVRGLKIKGLTCQDLEQESLAVGGAEKCRVGSMVVKGEEYKTGEVIDSPPLALGAWTQALQVY